MNFTEKDTELHINSLYIKEGFCMSLNNKEEAKLVLEGVWHHVYIHAFYKNAYIVSLRFEIYSIVQFFS